MHRKHVKYPLPVLLENHGTLCKNQFSFRVVQKKRCFRLKLSLEPQPPHPRISMLGVNQLRHQRYKKQRFFCTLRNTPKRQHWNGGARGWSNSTRHLDHCEQRFFCTTRNYSGSEIFSNISFDTKIILKLSRKNTSHRQNPKTNKIKVSSTAQRRLSADSSSRQYQQPTYRDIELLTSERSPSGLELPVNTCSAFQPMQDSRLWSFLGPCLNRKAQKN